MSTHGRSPDGRTPPRAAAVVAARAACVVGLLYALVSVYWGLGGTRLLDTVGGALAREGRGADPLLLVAVWVSVALKVVAAVLGLSAIRAGDGIARGWLSRRLLRAVAWTAAVILTVYGGVLTLVGLLVEAGVVAESRNADSKALRWHAYLWDPWFLVWGLLLTAALVWSRPLAPRADPT